MWGFLGGNFGGDKWGFLIDIVGIYSQDLLATLRATNECDFVNKKIFKFFLNFETLKPPCVIITKQ